MSVCGTGSHTICLAGFLGSTVTCSVSPLRRVNRTVGFQLGGWICLPSSQHTAFDADFRHRAAVSLLRHHVARKGSHGILTVRPSAAPFGSALGPDSPRDEQHCPGNLSLAAGGVLALLLVTYTYICFSMRSRIARAHHSRHMECSPTDTFIICYPATSVSALYPIIIHARTLDQ